MCGEKCKGHGKGNRVEGDLGKARNVVVIEDLISTGKSSLSAVEALRAEGSRSKGWWPFSPMGLI